MVEDDELVLEMVKTYLSNMGYHILTASNGEEALMNYLEKPYSFDLLLTDIIMPGISGRELSISFGNFPISKLFGLQ